jgi:soluble lytic murein transglycosylase-like protein
MTPSRADIIALAKKLSGSLDSSLVCAVIEQESGFDPWLIRYEPGFYSTYETKLKLPSITEATARAMSWGPMQVMGESAREVGYLGPFAQLCDAEVGVNVGCEVLRLKFAKASGDVRQALLYWNGGSNPKYPDEVMARIPKFKNQQ